MNNQSKGKRKLNRQQNITKKKSTIKYSDQNKDSKEPTLSRNKWKTEKASEFI